MSNHFTITTIGRIYVFLPSSVDVETQLTYIRKILREIYSVSRDRVVIALEPLPRDAGMAVSVIYDEIWRCQIYVNDDNEQVLLESKNWCSLYGTDLSYEQKQEIVTCNRRLDLYCGPDEEHTYDHDFEMLTQFLQLNFKSRFAFDPSQHRFVVSEI